MPKITKRMTIMIVFLLFAISLVPNIVSAQDDPCEGNYFFTDNYVGWCIPENWVGWGSHNSDLDDLEEMISENYNWDLDELYTFGGNLPVALQLRPEVVDNTAIYAEVFTIEYDPSYGSPEAYLEDISITGSTGDIPLSPDEASGRPIGVGVFQYEDTGAVRIWIMYPFPELDTTYVLVLYGPEGAITGPIYEELNGIAYSLYVTDEPYGGEPPGQQQSQSQTSDHPVWYGEQLTVTDASWVVYGSQGEVVKTHVYDGPYAIFEGSVWEIFQNGTIRFTPGPNADVASDLYPMTGTYSMNGVSAQMGGGSFTVSGGTITFDMESGRQVGNTASTTIQISGTINNTTGVVSVSYFASSISAATSILGTMGQTNTQTAEFTLTLSR